MAILKEDHPKIIHATLEETVDTVNLLVDMLNIKITNDDEMAHMDRQMILVVDLIRTKFGSLTIPEIREAFKMYVAKQFHDVRVFRLLDCVSVGEILNAYINARNEILTPYLDQKRVLLSLPEPKTENEIKQIRETFLKTIFDELKATGKSVDSWLLFDELEQSGKMITPKAEKRQLYAKLLAAYIPEQREVIRTQNTHSSKHVLELFTKKIQSGELIPTVQNRCKTILVNQFLFDHMENFETFKKIVENE